MSKTLYIIDGHAHIYAAYYAPMRSLTSPGGEPTKATYIFTNAILGLIQKYSPDMLVVAMDSKSPSFRTKIYSEYKAHRPPMPEDMPVQINRIEEILGAMNIPTLRVDGYEADDIIGTLAKDASKKDIDVYICSKDKDMLQLLDDHVKILDIKTGNVTDKDSMMADAGITAEQFLDVLALQGDTADNVPGVADVGPKTALQWIQKYGSIESLLKNIDQIKGKRGRSLAESKDILSLSKELVTIDCHMPVKIDYKDFEVVGPDRGKLGQIFCELDFSRLISQLELSIPKSGGASEEVSVSSGPLSVKTAKHTYRLIDDEKLFDGFYSELKKQKIFAIDTETTSINAMRADLVGMSFSFRPGEGYYLPIKAPLGSKVLDIEKVREKIGPILADGGIKKIGQNIKYDLLILKNAGMPVRGVYFDTMVASYCLDPLRRSNSMDAMAEDYLNYHCVAISVLIGKGKNQLTFDMVDTAPATEYAAEDADITLQLYEYLKTRLEKQPEIKDLFFKVEMPLVSVLAEMEYNGVTIKASLLRKMSGEINESINSLKDQIYQQAGVVFNIDSPKQLGEILFDRLGLESKKSGKTQRSTNASVLEQMADEHPIIGPILEYRQLEKLRNTYVDKLGTLINPRTNRVHASFNQTITATGRLSSSGPNLQNIPIRTELGRKIRAAFVAQRKDYSILSADYSQIELRLLAHLSKDRALLKAFEEDRDIHSFVASQIYDVPIDEVTKEMRSKCKAVNFGIIYGQGAFGLAQNIGISRSEAKGFIEDYFKRYSSIKQFMEELIRKAKICGYSETILHRRRSILDLNSKNGLKRSQAERLVVNTAIQGSAADLIKVAMVNIQREIDTKNLPIKMILQIHDELVFEVPTEEAGRYSCLINAEMTGAMKLDVPLKVDIAIGSSWLTDK